MPNVQSNLAATVADASTPTVSGISGDFETWLAQRRAVVEAALQAHLTEIKSAIGPHSRLADAVVYSVEAGGKRLRPILVLESSRLFTGSAEAALPAALAMEFVHTFSLIHDDLPAMDDDDLRRGKPTNHKVFGEALAILAGDWLLAHALGLLGSDRCGADRTSLVNVLRALSSGTQAMIAGQAADIESEGRPASEELVQYIHEHKTAALLETCCRLGAVCAEAPADAVAAISRYGRHLGLAFQIADDLLDTQGDEDLMGKRVGKDAGVAKQTYPAAFGVVASRAQARQEVEAALRALDPFGSRADRLRDLARFVIGRDH